MHGSTMSSETSTESQSLQPWQLFTLAGLLGATLVVFLSRDTTRAGVIFLSLIIFAAAAVGLAAWRTFGPLTGGGREPGPQVLGGRTRAALEREKTLVLRSIKELEFDRAMGKISEKDFAEMSIRLRGRAAGLLRQLDAGTGYREAIEQEIQRRIGRHSQPEAPRRPQTTCGACGTTADPDARFCTRCGARRCAACGTANEREARFCKQCGAGQETSA
jgi:hypothetical protein